MRRLALHRLSLLAAGLLLFNVALAADPATPASGAGAGLAHLLARPVTLRGTLDGVPIQMDLRLKPDETEALEGSYFAFGRSAKVLVAGEFEEDALMMEESANGKDVSGLWDGVYDGVALTGNWSSLDGTVLHPFVLKAVSIK